MKKFLTLLFAPAVIMLLAAAGTQQSGPVTTSRTARQLLTNETTALMRTFLGVDAGGFVYDLSVSSNLPFLGLDLAARQAITNIADLVSSNAVTTNKSWTTIIKPGDSTTEWQSAINAGGVVFVTPTNYTVGNLFLTNGVTIEAAGAKISPISGTTGVLLDTGTNTPTWGNIKITGLSFDGGVRSNFYSSYYFKPNIGNGSIDPYYNPYYSNLSGLRINGASGMIIDGCRFYGWSGNGVIIVNSANNLSYQNQRTLFLNNVVFSNFCGVTIPGASYHVPGFYNNGWINQAVVGGEYTDVANNTVFRNYTGVFAPAGNTRLALNSLNENYIAAIIASGGNSAHGIYSVNTVTHNAYGFWFESCNGGVITANENIANLNADFIFNGCTEIKASGNFTSQALISTNGTTGSYLNNWYIGAWGVSFLTNLQSPLLVSGNRSSTITTNSDLSPISLALLGSTDGFTNVIRGVAAGAGVTTSTNSGLVTVNSSGGIDPSALSSGTNTFNGAGTVSNANVAVVASSVAAAVTNQWKLDQLNFLLYSNLPPLTAAAINASALSVGALYADGRWLTNVNAGIYQSFHINLDQQKRTRNLMDAGYGPSILFLGDDGMHPDVPFAAEATNYMRFAGALTASAYPFMYVSLGSGTTYSPATGNQDNFWPGQMVTLSHGAGGTNLSANGMQGWRTTRISFAGWQFNGAGGIHIFTNAYGATPTWMASFTNDNGGTPQFFITNFYIPLVTNLVCSFTNTGTNICILGVGQTDTNRWAGFTMDVMTGGNIGFSDYFRNANASNSLRILSAQYSMVSMSDLGQVAIKNSGSSNNVPGTTNMFSMIQDNQLDFDFVTYTCNPTTNAGSWLPTSQDYTNRMVAIDNAKTFGWTLIDTWPLLFPLDRSARLGYYTDAAHLTDLGDLVVGKTIIPLLHLDAASNPIWTNRAIPSLAPYLLATNGLAQNTTNYGKLAIEPSNNRRVTIDTLDSVTSGIWIGYTAGTTLNSANCQVSADANNLYLRADSYLRMFDGSTPFLSKEPNGSLIFGDVYGNQADSGSGNARFNGNLTVTGTLLVTNAVASFAATASTAITATGWTNIWSTNNAVVVYGGTAVSSWKKRAGALTSTNITYPVFTGNCTVILQPGQALVIEGTGVSGSADPF